MEAKKKNAEAKIKEIRRVTRSTQPKKKSGS